MLRLINIFLIFKYQINNIQNNNKPLAGLEPATLRLRV